MSQEPCDSGIGKEDDGAMGEKGLVDELAKWLADNDGRYPRKQTHKQRKGSEWSCLQHRLFLYVRRQKEALSKGKGSESVEERVRQLSNISLVTHEASWNDKYNALREFLARGDPGAPAYPKQKTADVEEKNWQGGLTSNGRCTKQVSFAVSANRLYTNYETGDGQTMNLHGLKCIHN